MRICNADRAEVLVQALPYIQQYSGKIVVIKYGGNAMLNKELQDSVMRDIVLMSLVGIKVVLVHGGGPEITSLLEKMGKKTKFVDGLRVTDEETVQVAQMVLAGKISKNLVNLLETVGGKAMGLSGVDGHMIKAEQKDKRLGFVGDITDINAEPILDVLEKGYIPVVSTVGCDDEGNIYNINADTAAAKIAGELKAESLIALTDICGILKDENDKTTLISQITTNKAIELIENGIVKGGMIPKVECCVNAIKWGVQKVFILDGTIPHAILMETFTNEGVGTMFIKGGSV